MKAKIAIIAALVSTMSLPAFARRVVRPVRPRPLPPVVRPIPAPAQCDVYTVSRIAERLVQESRHLTQESRRLLGPSPKTRAARHFTQQARYFADTARATYRCHQLRAQLPHLRRDLSNLRQTFMYDIHRPIGLRPLPPHRPHHPGRGLYILQQQLDTVERVFGRLRRNVMQGRHYGPHRPHRPGRPVIHPPRPF